MRLSAMACPGSRPGRGTKAFDYTRADSRAPPSRPLRAGEQRIELARAVERHQVVVAADVHGADVDLRHGATPGALDHLDAPHGIEVDADLGDRGLALR